MSRKDRLSTSSCPTHSPTRELLAITSAEAVATRDSRLLETSLFEIGRMILEMEHRLGRQVQDSCAAVIDKVTRLEGRVQALEQVVAAKQYGVSGDMEAGLTCIGDRLELKMDNLVKKHEEWQEKYHDNLEAWMKRPELMSASSKHSKNHDKPTVAAGTNKPNSPSSEESNSPPSCISARGHHEDSSSHVPTTNAARAGPALTRSQTHYRQKKQHHPKQRQDTPRPLDTRPQHPMGEVTMATVAYNDNHSSIFGSNTAETSHQDNINQSHNHQHYIAPPLNDNDVASWRRLNFDTIDQYADSHPDQPGSTLRRDDASAAAAAYRNHDRHHSVAPDDDSLLSPASCYSVDSLIS